MKLAVAVAIGGAIGALGRYWVSTGVYAWLGRSFPFGTLAVNVIGSLLMGFLYILLLERSMVAPPLRAAILVGGLGAFTTFSTFSLETLHLLEGGQLWKALANILISVIACLVAVWLGMSLGKQL